MPKSRAASKTDAHVEAALHELTIAGGSYAGTVSGMRHGSNEDRGIRRDGARINFGVARQHHRCKIKPALNLRILQVRDRTGGVALSSIRVKPAFPKAKPAEIEIFSAGGAPEAPFPPRPSAFASG